MSEYGEKERRNDVENMVKTIEAALPEDADMEVVALAAAMILNRMCVGSNLTALISFQQTISGKFEG